jgi:hypothetical protein
MKNEIKKEIPLSLHNPSQQKMLLVIANIRVRKKQVGFSPF